MSSERHWCQYCQQHETASSPLKLIRGRSHCSKDGSLWFSRDLLLKNRSLLLPLCLAEVGSWWVRHRRNQLGNLLSDWFVHWRRVPNQSWGPARQCPGPTGSGLPSGSSGTLTPPQLWKEQLYWGEMINLKFYLKLLYVKCFKYIIYSRCYTLFQVTYYNIKTLQCSGLKTEKYPSSE